MIQRLFFAGAGLLGLLAAVHGPARTGSRVYSASIGLSALAGGGVAGRQVWLQHLPPDQVPQCGPGFDYLMDTYPILEALAKILRGSGECAEILELLESLDCGVGARVIYRAARALHRSDRAASPYDKRLRACEKIVASEGRPCSAGAQDRFAGSETERKPRRGSQGWGEQPECMLKYMRIPSTAGTRDPERSRFFHKL